MRAADEALRLVVEARAAGRGRQPLDQRPSKTREAAGALGEQVGDVGVVAAEELVATLAGERDLHVLGGQLRDQVGRQCGRVGERLVEGVGQRGQEQRRVGPQHELAVARAVALGDQARVGELVERALLEADRERPYRLCGLLRGERCERSGVDPAREQHTDGDVGQQVRPHGVAQPGAQLLDQLGLVVVAQLGDRDRRGPRVALEAHVAVLPDEHVPRRELAGLAEDRQRRRDRVEGEEGLERVEVDLPARQRAQLGGELEPVAVGPVVERLDPVAVAREHEPPAGRVPERDREHPAQAPEEGRALLLVQVDEHLGVAVRAEGVAGALELAAQLWVVVELAVLDDVDGAVLVRYRLVAGLEVDDREPAGGEADGPVDEDSVAVGAAVEQPRAHAREPLGVDGPARRDDSADPAHGVRV